MNAVFTLWLVCAGLGAGLQGESGLAQTCEPWEAPYAGEDATGPHVVALWAFDVGAETADSSGHGHTLTLQGAAIHPEGRFGACLESFPGWPVEDQRHAATAPLHPALSPSGPFTLEMWIKPKPQLADMTGHVFLMDKKYVAHTDYQWILGSPSPDGSRSLVVHLGFGEDSDTWTSLPARFEPGRWYHVAFTYDGLGTGTFFVDGVPWGSKRIGHRASIAPGRHALSLGDRLGSYYGGFPGWIDQVRITRGVREFRRLKLERLSDRGVFVRMEPEVTQRLQVVNLQSKAVGEARLTVTLDGQLLHEAILRDLAPGAAVPIEVRVDSRLRPDTYELLARVAVEAPVGFASEERIPLRIVGRKAPDEFPVVMWGVGSPASVLAEMERLRTIGFTHVLGVSADYGRIWEAQAPTEAARPETVAATKRMLDEALANGLGIVASLSPGSALIRRKELLRIDRQGQPYKREDLCALFPEVHEYCYHVGASVARTYGHFPALAAALVHTEVRDQANPCFHPHDLKAFQQATGLEAFPEGVARWGVDYTKLADFPASRVIPDNHPIYVYCRWYWKSGDGWNGLNTAVARGLKSTGREDLWTWHDPAARVASVYGSGGDVDILSQWTYSYPDPIRIGLATDELLAFAAGADRPQHVMKMTQIIWYRSQTAPQAKSPAEALPYQARWEHEQPDAPFITIAPMHLREAFWTKIARPIRGIMYHGWQSLVPCEPLRGSGYRYTHPATQHELARLLREVLRPLGPTLRNIPAVRSDVALLESFASEMFARRGTYGWGGSWAGDCYHVLQYAHLQPEIVFDETIAARGLEGYRVLVMPDCDVLTETVARRIQAFQAQGGLIVGDERTCPAIQPDIVLKPYQRTGRASDDKAALVALAAELRHQLDGRYTRPVDTSNPEVIPYRRAAGPTDYVFLVNDRREYGDYVGHHGLVMENGLPAEAVVSVRRPEGHVYDLVHGQPVPASVRAGRVEFDVQLGPCDGGLWMITPRPIHALRIQIPAEAERPGQVPCRIELVDAEGQRLEATVPLEITIVDAQARIAEQSGFYAAQRGAVELVLDIAPNDPWGTWQVVARERASGCWAASTFRVPGPTPWPPNPPPPSPESANPVQPKG